MDEIRFSQVDFDPFADGEIVKTAPSTESQKEIWLSVQIGGDNANCSYNESVMLTIEGGIDVDIMKKALKTVVERHDALRTTLSTDGSTLSISSNNNYDFPYIDLSAYADSDKESTLKNLLEKEVIEPFDLEHGPLFQTKIVKMTPSEFRLIITGHHIVLDGWSIAVVIEDLNDIYTAYSARKTFSKPDADSFSAYALSLSESQSGTENIANESFWIDQFKDSVPVLDIPTSWPRPSKRTYNAEPKTFVLDRNLIAGLKKFSASAKTSLTVVLLAGFKILLHRLSRQEEIVVGLPAADQAVTGLHQLVGHCVNTLPLKSTIFGDMTVSEFIGKVKGNMLSAYDHQRFTYGSILKKLKISRDLSRHPLVSILFNIDPGMKLLNISGIKTSLTTNLRKFENFDMFLNGTDVNGEIVFDCLYNSDIFDKDTMEWRMNEYITILKFMMARPESRIKDIEMIPPDEEELLIRKWNRTACDYPKGACTHELFKTIAEDFPGSIALEFGDQSMRSEERRVGKECRRLCRSRWSPYH
jgi:hypothetical protein